ncbi:MAG: anti-sigma factor [Pyrinomonadaceae bacterium]
MTEEQRELFFDLLAKKAVYGLDETDDNQLAEFDRGLVDAEFCSLEATAAAIGLAGISEIEPLPEHLRAQILKNAPFVEGIREDGQAKIYTSDDVFGEKRSSWFGWLGWAAAAAACVALGVNIWFTRIQPTEQVKNQNPPETQQSLTERQKHDQLLAAGSAIKANWAAGNVKEIAAVTGDIIWSDEKQTGYMLFRGLPVNDAATCYQLWIFDKNQKKETPIDGGVFKVTSDGEVVVPITAKLKANSPYLFAVTIEKDGGVVVSDRQKIAALAKVETQSS